MGLGCGPQWRRCFWQKYPNAIHGDVKRPGCTYHQSLYREKTIKLYVLDVATTLRGFPTDQVATFSDILNMWAKQHIQPLMDNPWAIACFVFEDYTKYPEAKRQTQQKRDKGKKLDPNQVCDVKTIATPKTHARYWECFFRFREHNMTLLDLCARKILSLAQKHHRKVYVAPPVSNGASEAYRQGHLIHYNGDHTITTIGPLKYGEGDVRIVECLKYLKNEFNMAIVKTTDLDLWPILSVNRHLFPRIQRLYLHLSPLSKQPKPHKDCAPREFIVDIAYVYREVFNNDPQNAKAFTFALTLYGTDFTDPLKGCASNIYLIDNVLKDIASCRALYGNSDSEQESEAFIDRVKSSRAKKTATITGQELRDHIHACFDVVKYWCGTKVKGYTH